MTFKSLLPKDLDEELKPYEQAFDAAINSKKEKIANIAVTGNYGAGKSSVISSFLNNERWFLKWKLPKWKIFNGQIFKRDRAITISLATFELKGYEPDQLNQKIQNIEFSILQQLIHKAHPNKLPKSRFERIINKHSKHNYLSTFMGIFSIGLLTLSLLLMFGWKPLVGKLDFTDIYSSHSFIIIPILLILIIFYYLSCYIVQAGLFNKQDIQSLDLLKGQATFKNKREQSVLNLFLDEILYFFEVTKYDVVVFEDLDRHEHKEIFIRLREINQQINNSGQVKRTIKFIYAVKDDLFTEQESRVKFFDFIIPIIPVMDFDNSYLLLKKEIERIDSNEGKILRALDSEFLLRDVSAHINDMRLLVNIVNEYSIYLKQDNKNKVEREIKEGEQNNYAKRLQKIFALIVYKNLMPEDFSLIKSKQSILCDVVRDFRNKTFINKILAPWKAEKNNKETLLRNLDSVKNLDESTLKADVVNQLLFPQTLVSSKEEVKHQYYNNEVFDEHKKVEFFNNKILRDTKLEKETFYTKDNNQFVTPTIDSISVNNILDDYEEKFSFIQQNSEKQRLTLNTEINELNKKITATYSLAQIISLLRDIDRNDLWEEDYYQLGHKESVTTQESQEKQKLNQSENTQQIKVKPIYQKKPIIFMLMRKGYVDQTYINYLSLSHDNKQELIEFRASLSDNDQFEQTFDIDLDEKTIQRFLKEDENILAEHARTQSVLNYCLLKYLTQQTNYLPAKEIEKNFFNDIINFHFIDENSFNLNFLIKFLAHCSNDDTREIGINLVVKIFESPIALRGFLNKVKVNSYENMALEEQIALLIFLLKINPEVGFDQESLDKIKLFIISINDFINCFDRLSLLGNVENIISWISKFEININLMQPERKEDSIATKLFENIIEANLYNLTAENIQEIFKFDNKPFDGLSFKNYSSIYSHYGEESSLVKYVEENISEYVDKVLIADKSASEESNESIIKLINNENIRNSQRIELIKQCENFKFDGLYKMNRDVLSIIDTKWVNYMVGDTKKQLKIETQFREHLLSLDLEYRKEGNKKYLIDATWINTYWLLIAENKLSNKITNSWLEKVYVEIAQSSVLSQRTLQDQLKKLIVFNNELSIDAYVALVISLNMTVDDSDYQSLITLSWEKITILMENKLLKGTKEMVSTLYMNFFSSESEEEDEDNE